MNILTSLASACEEVGVHESYEGYRGNCANIAVALYEIAVEMYGNDEFRFVLIDRPSHFGESPDHIALEYHGRLLDSKGVWTRSELVEKISEENNESALLYESKEYVVQQVPYYEESIKEEVKKELHQVLEGL